MLGLAIGIACCILILLYVQDELNYDRYNENAGQIYRIALEGRVGDNQINAAVTCPPLAQALMQEFPEVLQAARIDLNNNMLIRYQDKAFNETRFYWADSNIFKIFTIPLLQGDPQKALAQPHTIVITKDMAAKYFGNEDPIDKFLIFEDGTPYRVTGVAQNCPRNSHFHYDFLAAMHSRDDLRDDLWLNNRLYTYILVKEGTPQAQLQAKMADIVNKYVGPELETAMGVPFDKMLASGGKYRFVLQPLLNIHLHSDLMGELEANSDIRYIYIFSIIAVFILLIACFNFMNLATARSANRAREVGIRKVMGSNRPQLIRQFIIESILLTFIAVILAMGIVELMLPLFNNLAGKQLETSYFGNWLSLLGLAGVVIFVGLLAGSYPAFYLASFQPVSVLKGKLSKGTRGAAFRSMLVVFQFAISIILFISTFLVHDQLMYIQNKKLGFNKDHVVVIHRAWALGRQVDAFKTAITQNTNIISAGGSTALPGNGPYGASVYKPEGGTLNEQYLISPTTGDYDYAKTLDLTLKEGRFFSREISTDTLSVVLNETAVKTLGLKDPLNQRVILMGPTPEQSQTFKVIGIIEDFNFESLHQIIRPLAIHLQPYDCRFMNVRIRPENIQATLSFLEKQWKTLVPDKPFDYTFLSEDYAKQYQAEQHTGKIFTAFSVLAIFIACLGLFGLASFTAEQRTKEIGVRKVLGASVPNLILLLSREFTKWVVIANIIAWPAAYFAMNHWLQNFAYRIHPGFTAFFISAILALLISLATVSYQAIKAATANPVKSLRYE
ncbi:MAG: ABC transporter permease [Calditrichia bacterium]